MNIKLIDNQSTVGSPQCQPSPVSRIHKSRIRNILEKLQKS